MAARLTPEQFAELQAIDSPTIANAIEPFNVRGRVQGYVGYDIRCLIPGLGTMLGYAITCKGDSTTEGKNVERQHQKLYEAIAASPKPATKWTKRRTATPPSNGCTTTTSTWC